MYLKISETLTDMMSELLNGQIDSWTEISSRASLLLNFSGHCCVCLLFFFSSEELLERHTSCNVPPSHKNHELFLLPINPLIPSVLHCFILSFRLAYTHFTPSFSWLWLLPQTRWKPSASQPPSCWEEERFHAFLTFTLVSSQVCNFHHWVWSVEEEETWLSVMLQLVALCFLYICLFLSLFPWTLIYVYFFQWCLQHPPRQSYWQQSEPLMVFSETLI